MIHQNRKRKFTAASSDLNVEDSISSWPIRMAIAAVVLSSVLHPASAFQAGWARTGGAFCTQLHASSRRGTTTATTTSEVIVPEVQRVKPRTTISAEQRRRAYSAMKKAEVDSALNGINAQMLELLSDKFLYPPQNGGSSSSDSASANTRRKRPKGRPEFVPGAMTFETLIKFRERQDAIERMDFQPVSDAEVNVIAPYVKTTTNTAVPPAVAPPMNGKVKGTSMPSTSPTVTSALPSVASTEDDAVAAKKRKRVFKNLPNPKKTAERIKEQQQQEEESDDRLKRVAKNANGMDLHKYYRTELLTPDEEYSLGMKIQFMIACEQVHEGLAAHLNRLPTMEEWAEACGFSEPDPSFLATEADELLRPAGSESMFEEIDPLMFVGNGLAYTAGPGRGRGRAKKPPPLKLKDFYDDSEMKVPNESGAKTTRRRLKPINRGTPTDFVEMMMTAREAKQRMVQSNMRLVISIARKYANVGVSLQDLVQEGSLGLSRAAEKFEPKKGFKFSTYASWWIQQAVFRSIAYHSRTIRLPVHVHNLLNRIRKVKSALQSSLGRPPSNEEIAQQLGMTLAKFNKMLRLTKRSISLELPKYQQNPKDLGHEGDDLLGDTIAASSVLDEATPEKSVDQGLFHEDLKDMLTILEEDERKVICARYGLSDGLTRTVTAVAAQMRQSKAWVRSQECRALRKLRRPWYEKKLKEHQDALSN